MPTPPKFHPLTLEEFDALVDSFDFRRRISEIHMHGTWRPRRADYRGEESIIAMWKFHTQTRGWSDIAQHVTIAPDGIIWTGRDWNRAPASAEGANGKSTEGPFMFEMVGDFDVGKEPLDGKQREAAVRVIAKLRDRFRLEPEALVFHREIPSGKAQGKTCPGSSVDKEQIRAEVERELEKIKTRRRALTLVDWAGPEQTAAKARARAIQAMLPAATAPSHDEGGPLEGEDDPTMAASARDVAFDLAFLRPHVVTLHDGLFASAGILPTSASHVDAIFNEHLPKWASDHPGPLRIVFWAHGGLNEESTGLAIAAKQVKWWKDNGVYPIHFVWHTGFWEALQQKLFGARQRALATGTRDFYDWTTDPGIEFAARALGLPGLAWSGMKKSAELGCGEAGGARYVARGLAAFCGSRAPGSVALFAAGHSAGSIFHAYFVPTMLREGVPPLRELFFLAPAMRGDLFKATIAPLVGGRLDKLTMFTMSDQLEQDDSVGPYHKSLLFLVSHALEDIGSTPILGLERALRDDAALGALFGLGAGSSGTGEVVWSDGGTPAGPRAASTSTSHGGFDDDPPTMDSIVRRVVDSDTIVGFPKAPAAGREFRGAVAARGGRRLGACIGIDRYPAPNTLAGCVADARDWNDTLKGLGFTMRPLLLDEAATRQAILDLMRDVLGESRAGDVVVFQLAGHGTQFTDAGAEDEDGKDEAFVPIDFGTGAFILDDDFWDAMSGVPDGVSVTCIFDCCHSGTITRLFGAPPPPLPPGVKVRFIRATTEMTASHRRFRALTPRSRAVSRHDRNEMRRVVFSACQDVQVAEELDGRGAFSRRATAILRNGLAGLTNDAYYDAVIRAFGTDVARQRPALDCPDALRGLPLFGGIERDVELSLAQPPGAAAPSAPPAGGIVETATALTATPGRSDPAAVARLLRDIAALIDGDR